MNLIAQFRPRLFTIMRFWLLILQKDCLVERHPCRIYLPDAEGTDDRKDSEAQRGVIHNLERLSVGQFDGKLTGVDDLLGDSWNFGICCWSVHERRLDNSAETIRIDTRSHQSLLNFSGQKLLKLIGDD